ncbi:Uncharacterized protein BM_BM17850 [Brugia malayi]|uniref:C2H2-type domain-containing protein n=1 Tax=Brugia malayi TaxID=6279 RepID=A0A4E9FYK3_BRUMA|nr:Uncharacterized protein BM_BM17850 [Brugia malayi]VIO99563.1 Uncharacterized protein BM_BM17850 [Brugia malayi]
MSIYTYNSPIIFNKFHSNWQQIILIDMHFIYFFCFFFQLINIQTTAAQTDQTEPLDLYISKVRDDGDGSQGLSMGIEDEIGLQMLQTKRLDLPAPKLKKEENKSQALSMKGVSDERITPRRELVRVETPVEVMELSKQQRRTKKKQRCYICQKEVVNIKEHMMTHTGEKPFSCFICKKDFSRSSYVKGHMRTHTGEKPYSCPTCKKFFNNFSNMKKHMMTHTGEKPYSCPICKKNFSRSSHVKGHMITHTGEKPHSCPVCGKSYVRKSDLHIHTAIHGMNSRPVYHCTICSKDFQRKLGLKLHMKKH